MAVSALIYGGLFHSAPPTRRRHAKGGRFRAAAGIVGPAAFTAAWIAESLRQSGHDVMSFQISGLAAPDAKDSWIMITGFVTLGGCAVVFGHELRREFAGPAPRLIQVAGVLAVAAGVLRRDHMPLTTGHVSWHNQAHNVISLLIYACLVAFQLLLARGFRANPSWHRWHPWLLASGAATAAVMAVFIPNTSSPEAGALQRIAVSIPLVAMSAVAARLIKLNGREAVCHLSE